MHGQHLTFAGGRRGAACVCRKAGLSEQVEIASAGTIGMHAGELPDARMRAAALRRGYELKSRARQITRADFDHHDLILTMDAENLRTVLALASTDEQRARVIKFVDFCEKHDDSSMPVRITEERRGLSMCSIFWKTEVAA